MQLYAAFAFAEKCPAVARKAKGNGSGINQAEVTQSLLNSGMADFTASLDNQTAKKQV